MVIKKDLIIAILSTFCLTSALFITLPAKSNSGIEEYDPWIDVNDDGYINIKDIVLVSAAFGASGTPINKTALLLELRSRIDALNASIRNLEAYFETRIDTLNATITEQQSKIAELESEIAVLNATKLGKPDWQQWVTIPAGNDDKYYHNLGTTNVLVYMVGYDYDGYDFHQICYGGDSYVTGSSGVWWSGLTTTEIVIYRLSTDQRWDLIHIMIWKLP